MWKEKYGILVRNLTVDQLAELLRELLTYQADTGEEGFQAGLIDDLWMELINNVGLQSGLRMVGQLVEVRHWEIDPDTGKPGVLVAVDESGKEVRYE